ncbi:hypothetical protein T484DRAFT_1767511 [Baffinella frigidus]|nr:hypothetical protein T484DRAFT_1767511 [Cryptophyta sp. CCMP2293]
MLCSALAQHGRGPRTQSAEQLEQAAIVIQDDVRRRFAEIARAVEGDTCSLDWSSATHLLSLPKFLSAKDRNALDGGSVDPAQSSPAPREGAWSADSSFLLSLGSCPDASGEDALSSVSMESSSSLLLHPCEGRVLHASPPRPPAPAHRPPPSPASPNKQPSPSSNKPRSSASRSFPSSPSTRSARGALSFSTHEQGPAGAGGGQPRSSGDASASATPTKPPADAEATQRLKKLQEEFEWTKQALASRQAYLRSRGEA